MPPPVAPKEEVVGSPGIPAAVSERPPRKGPIERYFIPLKSGSPSFFSSLSSWADGVEAAGGLFCAASNLRFRSFCWEKVRVTDNRTNNASTAACRCTLSIMNSRAPEKEFAVANGNARSAKRTDGRPSGWGPKNSLTTKDTLRLRSGQAPEHEGNA